MAALLEAIGFLKNGSKKTQGHSQANTKQKETDAVPDTEEDKRVSLDSSFQAKDS